MTDMECVADWAFVLFLGVAVLVVLLGMATGGTPSPPPLDMSEFVDLGVPEGYDKEMEAACLKAHREGRSR